MADPAFSSAGDRLAAMRRGEVSSLKLADAAIARIEKVDDAINAMCVRNFDVRAMPRGEPTTPGRVGMNDHCSECRSR